MSLWRVVVSRLRSLVSKSREEDLRDELDGHVRMLTERHVRAGLAPNEARRAALVEIGGLEQIKEDVRDARVGRAIAGVLRDVRQGVRVLRRSPRYTAALVMILALGIGANGAVFGILRAVLLQPLPYRDVDRVVMVWKAREHPPATLSAAMRASMARGVPSGDAAVTIHNEARDVLADSATYFSWQGDLEAQFDLAMSDHTERLRGMLVTPNFFEVLGVSAAKGRVFTSSDERAGEPMIVLSHGLWLRAFGGDAAIVGRPVTLIVGRPRRPQTFTVIGILPSAFRFTHPKETEAWAIYRWADVIKQGRGRAGYRTVARLAPGVTLATAQARVAAIPASPANRRPELREIFRLEPITESVVGDTRPTLLLLGAVALLLLVTTCATVASALFVRMTERQRELAVRAALGADRWRLARQLLTEGLVLSATGAALGTAVAVVLAPMLRRLVPSSIPRADEIGVSISILGFFAAAAGATTILAALAPSWRAGRLDVALTLKRASTAVSADVATARWRQALVGVQAAMATALLLAAGLLLASFWRLSHMPLGFDGERVLTVEMRLISPKYLPPRVAGQTSDSRVPSAALMSFQDQLLAGVRALPGVLDAGITSAVPFRGVDFSMVLTRAGDKTRVGGNGRFVEPGYFSVLQVPLTRGRMFTGADTPASPRVVIISDEYARRMFGAEDPIGKVVDDDGAPLEVVGVVGDMRYSSFESDPNPAIYFPRSQSPSELICVVARTAPNAADVGAEIRRLVRRLDPEVPAMNVTTIDQIVSESVADRRFYTTATAAFASLALILTIAGLVVVISRAVVERRRELAIRAALGASGWGLIGLVVRQGLIPVIMGAAAGLVAVFMAARVLQPFLFHVAPRAPLAYSGIAILVIIVAVASALVPAHRATRTAPAEALRAE